MNKNEFFKEFHDATEAIEATYEFMLAYAAQGRTDEDESSSPNIRELLVSAEKALLKLTENDLNLICCKTRWFLLTRTKLQHPRVEKGLTRSLIT